jgi:hypothetical protein
MGTEGSPRYAEATWRRATTFLRKSAESLWDNFGAAIEIPRVLPGPKLIDSRDRQFDETVMRGCLAAGGAVDYAGDEEPCGR